MSSPTTADEQADGRLFCNGINGATSEFLTPPVSLGDLAALVRGEPPPDPDFTSSLPRSPEPIKGLPFNIDPLDVPRSGWAVVFPEGTPHAVRDALLPLVKHRQSQIPADRCKELEYKAGETLRSWLLRHGVSMSRVAPSKVPYYVLLVGGPELIPFEFQYLLDVEYAVGDRKSVV